MLIARVIADTPTLQTRLEALEQALAVEGMSIAMSRLLHHESNVLHLSLPDGEIDVLKQHLGTHFGGFDMLVTDADIGIPKLFVSDMDSTMIGQECIDELADFAGLKDQVSAITERAMRGELDFESALRERVGLLAGLDEAAIGKCLHERIRPMAGARRLVATLRAKGCRTVLVTGGFHHFADPVAGMLGFERVVGNRLAVANGKLTGQLDGPITDSATKEQVLREELAQLPEGAVALAAGDGANDIPMLQAARYGIAYHAKPAAAQAANGRIDQGDLTAILRLLDIPESDWIAG